MKIKKSNKDNLFLYVVIVILCLILIFLTIQNFHLQKEVTKLNNSLKSVLDNFNLFLIEKVGKCESVMLMIGNKSAVVNEVHCK